MNEKQNGLSEKADAAFRETATAVIERAKQTGTPVVVWEDGHVKEVSGEHLEQSAKEQTENTKT